MWDVFILKSYNHLFEKMLDKEFIKQNIYDAAKHKTKRNDVKHVLNNIDYHVDYIFDILNNGSFKICIKDPVIINESTCKKTRVILRPNFMPDLIIQHMVVKILQPIFIKHFYQNSCASIPNKGPNYGRKILNKFIFKNNNHRMYVFKCDIRKFFEHINRTKLRSILLNKIHDKKFTSIIDYILFYNDDKYGIPLGFYSSQWFANLYLTKFDFIIKQKFSIPFSMRYMDDIVIIDYSKRKLHRIINFINEYLETELNLKLKHDYQLFKFDNRCIDYMGFKFYKNKTTLRKQTLYKIR